jgi:cytochrome P450
MSQCPVAHGYDPLDPATVNDPYPRLNELREAGPVFYMPDLDHYIITRYADIEQILLDRERWSASNASSPLIPVCPAAQAVLNSGFTRVPTLNNADPPRHGAMRKAVLACMTPRRLNALEPTLRAYARNLVEGLVDEDEFDFVERLAFPFPGYAAFSLLGFPDEDTEQLKHWSRRRVLLTYGRLSDAEQVDIAGDIVAFWSYVTDHVARRAAHPADDVTSDLLRYAEGKPDQVTQFDVVNMVYSMALAGHETLCNTIGNGILALMRNRDQWQRLVDDPSLIPNAGEEILRYDGPVLNHRRVAKVDVEVGGVLVPAGGRVMMCFGSAGHDPDLFTDPESFAVDRTDAEAHLAFGKGAHLCLGAPLARLELRIVLELLTELTPDLDLVPDQSIEYIPNALFRGLKSLRVAPRGRARVGAARG